MSIACSFNTCLVCGADVLTLADSDEIPMCSTHSIEDRMLALEALNNRIAKAWRSLSREGGINDDNTTHSKKARGSRGES